MKRYPKNSFSWTAIDYAKRVISGKIPASWQVRTACQRMIDDFDRPDLIFSPDHVDHVCEFMQALVHIKGEWAGRPVILEPFQVWILANIFGFLRKSDGMRRYRSAFILLPRKNGKSLLAAGIGLYMGFADGEAGAEVYCGASNLAQANEVFVPAKRMADMSPGFTDAFGVEVMARSIFSADSGSNFVPVIANTKDGSSPHCAICDELHQARDATQIQAFRTGMGARRQPLLLVISTAGVDQERSRQEAIAQTIEAALVPRLDAIDAKAGKQVIVQRDREQPSADRIAAAIVADPNYRNCSVTPDVLADRNAIRASLDAAIPPIGN